ncbi:MAG TPA: hypothetical protein VLE02_02710 [Nitrosarchaeum sp.]|nr:hypothetical protein [Nitrosarchaeum sp.]
MNKLENKIKSLEAELKKKDEEIQQIKSMAIADIDTRETVSQKLSK